MNLLFLLTIVPAYLVGSFFVKHDPGPEEPKKALKLAVIFGVVAIGLALGLSFLFDLLINGDAIKRISGVASPSSLPLFVDVLIFATIEEFVKFIPIAVYIERKDYFNEHTDGIIYFAIVGLTFGGIESFLYGLGSGDAGFAVALVRLALGLFFHGALTSIVGFYFVRAKLRGHGMALALLVLGAVSIVHTFYNYFIYTSQNNPALIFGSAICAIGANALMFWLFYAGTKADIAIGMAGSKYTEQRRLALQQQIMARQAQFMANQQMYAQPVQMTPAQPQQQILQQTAPQPTPNVQGVTPQYVTQPPVQPPQNPTINT